MFMWNQEEDEKTNRIDHFPNFWQQINPNKSAHEPQRPLVALYYQVTLLIVWNFIGKMISIFIWLLPGSPPSGAHLEQWLFTHTSNLSKSLSLGKLKACSCGCVFVGTHPAFDFPKLSHLQAFYLPPFLFPFARYALMFIGRFCFNELPESARHHFWYLILNRKRLPFF